MEQTYTHPEIGKITITKRFGNKNFRIRVHPTKGVMLSAPYLSSNKEILKVIEENLNWIKKNILKAAERKEEKARLSQTSPMPKTEEEWHKLIEEAKKYLYPRIGELALKYGFAEKRPEGIYYEFKQVTLKNNKTNWGSCSTKKNINLNIRLMLVPEYLRDYIIIHELCHLRHPNHGPKFHCLLNSLLDGKEKQYSKELRELTIGWW